MTAKSYFSVPPSLYNKEEEGSVTEIVCPMGKGTTPCPAQLSESPAASLKICPNFVQWKRNRRRLGFYNTRKQWIHPCSFFCTSIFGLCRIHNGGGLMCFKLHINCKSTWAFKGLRLRLIDIHSEYKFQIRQASLYGIDFLQWLLWKQCDYFFSSSVRTNRGLKAADK